jgi:hypothetical protein
MAPDTGDIHMQNVVGLKTRPQRFKEDQAKTLKAVLLPFLDDPTYDQEPIHRLLHEIDRKTRPDAPAETFVMIKPAQNAAVVDWLEANSSRPMKAMRLWALMFEHLYPHTGQIMLTRDQIAERIGIRPNEVSEIMGELVSFRAIFTERRRLEGVRGPGKVVYFMNKHVAEAGSRATEEELRLIPKPGFTPRIIEGGQQFDIEDVIKGAS